MTNSLLRRVRADELCAVQLLQLPDVGEIVDAVRTHGDAALDELAMRFGDPAPRRIAPAAMQSAYEAIGEELRTALDAMAVRIARFAQAQREAVRDLSVEIDGTLCGHRATPVASAAIYVPAGRYPLPSSLLMGCIPARIAGVGRIVVASPSLAPEMLAAAHIAGIREYHVLGGAQAIAALAYGTEGIAPVDFIAGPGNAYVTAAKRAVYGVCGIDALAGPSEVLIVASREANPQLVAADLLAQAEHDTRARCVLLSESESLVDAVACALEDRLTDLPTAALARTALRDCGYAAVLSLPQAVREANRLAPEHLQLHGEAACDRAAEFTSFGSLFIGELTAEVFGDYGAGPNHILPTGGTARFSSGLSVLSFLQLRTYQRRTERSTNIFAQAAAIASCEGLHAHARAATARVC